jgi:DNA repair exonuclease SbcCD nuclease subunit
MIKLIVHLADLHIRTTQYHEIYESQFEKLYKDLHQLIGSKYDFNDVRIVIAGDIFHN